MRRALFGILAFAAGVGLVALPAQSQPPAKDGKGAKGAKAGPAVGVVVPPALLDELKLTDAKKAELKDIEKDLKGRLDKLFTDDQKKLTEAYQPAAKGKGPPPKEGNQNPGPTPAIPSGPETAPRPREPGQPLGDAIAKEPPAIQWYATLARGLAEAERTGKPILFVSAAPHCAGVSGMW